ncbi:MAG: hypothetical protein V1904_14380 [Bacteroidota bacterium]
MNSPEIKEYIRKRSCLFWYIREEEKENINPVFLVETILNYGDEKDVKELFKVMGIETVADIFRQATNNRTRINYFPAVLNFFNLYFQRNAPGYSY